MLREEHPEPNNVLDDVLQDKKGAAPGSGENTTKHNLHLWDLHEKHNQDVGHIVHLNSRTKGTYTCNDGEVKDHQRTATAEPLQYDTVQLQTTVY